MNFFEFGQTPKKILQNLTEQPCNNYCVDCSDPLAQNVDVTHFTFVCVACSAIHRELGFKIKSIGVSQFTDEEIERLKNHSNDEFNNVWMSSFKRGDQPLLPASNESTRRQFLQQKYMQKRWHKNNASRYQKERRTMFPENDDETISSIQNKYQFRSDYNDNSYQTKYQDRNQQYKIQSQKSYEEYSDDYEDEPQQRQPQRQISGNQQFPRGNPFSNNRQPQFPQAKQQNEFEPQKSQKPSQVNRNSPFQNHQSSSRNSPFQNHQPVKSSFSSNSSQPNLTFEQNSHFEHQNSSYQPQNNFFQGNLAQPNFPSSQQQNQNHPDLFDLLSISPQQTNPEINQPQAAIQGVFGFSTPTPPTTRFPQKKERNVDPFAASNKPKQKHHQHANKESKQSPNPPPAEIDDLIGFSVPQNQPTAGSDLLNFGVLDTQNTTIPSSVSDDLLDFNHPQVTQMQQRNDQRQSLKETLGMLDDSELTNNTGNTGNIQMLRNQGLGVQDSPILLANKLIMSGYCSQPPRQGYQGQMRPQVPGQQPYFPNRPQ